MEKQNLLGYEPVNKLLWKFAIPSVIAMLVGAIYNIVDQLFIGNTVGTLGNAATNVAFPFVTICIAIALVFGIGGASCFNLTLGRGDKEDAPYYLGNSLTMLIISGIIITVLTQLFLEPILIFVGSPTEVLPYAKTYVSITSIGFIFLILTSGGGHLMRADGSPMMTMFCSSIGAIINVVLDAYFMLVLNMGMAGAALATIIGQIISGIIVILYFLKFSKTVKLKFKHIKVELHHVVKIMTIGMASFINQLAMLVVQIVMNNSLAYYGAQSIYGSAIPMACVGIAVKVTQVFFSIVIGIGQGSQPIESFNYGAKQYDRVRKTYYLALMTSGIISFIAFAIIQLFPGEVLALFGNGSKLYVEFGIKTFRTFCFFICLNFLQPVTATFFTSIGKPKKGVFLSLTRQILYLLPLAIILPRFFGVIGLLYAPFVSDMFGAATAIIMGVLEVKNINSLEKETLSV